MKVSISWLKELIKLDREIEEVINLLPLRTVGIKEVTSDYFELDMKGYNRPDLLSLRGVALEIAAISDSQITFKEVSDKDYVWVHQSLPQADILVEDSELAPVYCVAKIENLKVENSPKAWIEKLASSGMRTVNNVADVTNLVMLEYGQPLHAFDADTIADGKIIVRTAAQGEKIVTLDNKTRELLISDLLIADPKKALGVAGVMGGKNSEVTETTTTIFLEAAIFDPVNLRKTATRLGLQSEASKRFQHGLAKKRCLQALDAAIKMYQDLGGTLTAISIIGNLEDQKKEITVNKAHIDSLIGVEIPEKDIENYLQKLNFTITRPGLVEKGQALRRHGWTVIPPYYRLDINIEVDIIEEIARMYGYERLPAKELKGEISTKIEQTLFNLINDLKNKLEELRFFEVQTYSFYSTKVLTNLDLNTKKLIKIANPMSAETQFMRDNIWPNLLESLAKNLKYKSEVAVFEINKTYYPGKEPKEEYHLSLALSNDNEENIKQLYSVFEKVNQELNLGVELDIKKMGKKPACKQKESFFHPVRFWQLTKKGKRIGQIAEVHPRIVNKFGMEKRVAILEINLEEII